MSLQMVQLKERPVDDTHPIPMSSLTGKIPTELLLTIFKLAVEGDEPSNCGLDAGAETAFNIASVCRLWRDVALDYPLLWRNISFRSPAVTSLMLERVKQAPTRLHVNLQSRCNISNLQYALQRALPTASELSVKGRYASYISKILSHLNAATGALQSLELLAPDMLASQMYILLPSHLAKPTPMQLRRLVLECATFESRSSAFLPIHCIHLVHLELRAVQHLHIQHAFSVLEAAAGTLETIVFDGPTLDGDSTVQGSFPPQMSLNMPCLTRLAFTGILRPFEAGSPLTLLRHLTYPNTTSLELQIHVSHHTIQYAVLDIAAAHLRDRRPLLGLQSALLSSEEAPRHPGVRMRMWKKRNAPDLFNLEQHSRPLLDLRVTRSSDTGDWLAVRTLGMLADAAGFDSVTKLSVAPLRPEVPWARILTRVPVLREISLYGPANVENLCVACTPALMFDGSTPPYHPNDVVGLLPALNALSVNGISFRSGYFQERTQNFEIFRACLQGLRNTLGRPLSELILCYCDTQLSDVEELAPHIKDSNIIWDGSERGTESVPVRMEAVPAPSPSPAFNLQGMPAFLTVPLPQIPAMMAQGDNAEGLVLNPFEPELDMQPLNEVLLQPLDDLLVDW